MYFNGIDAMISDLEQWAEEVEGEDRQYFLKRARQLRRDKNMALDEIDDLRAEVARYRADQQAVDDEYILLAEASEEAS